MKYLEELEAGDCCTIDKSMFIVTTDFKKNGSKLLINLVTGLPSWYQPSTVCDKILIFSIDEQNNSVFIPLKPEKQNENHIY